MVVSGVSSFGESSATQVQSGALVEWDDAKGYGWVISQEKRYFAHIKDFQSEQRRPKAGMKLQFVRGMDPKGRPCAKQVMITGMVLDRRGGLDFEFWMLFLGLWIYPLLALQRLPLPWWFGAVWMLVISSVTYWMYAHDKRCAESAAWRVPESRLHFLECIGGWPGALLAQRRLRHKSAKRNYQFVFWFIVVIHQLVALDVFLRHLLSRKLLLWLLNLFS